MVSAQANTSDTSTEAPPAEGECCQPRGTLAACAVTASLLPCLTGVCVFLLCCGPVCCVQVQSYLAHQPEGQRRLDLQLGINEVGLSGSTGSRSVYDPRTFVSRNMRIQMTEQGRPALAVATHEVGPSWAC